MSINNKYESLINDIIEKVGNGFYNKENYKYLHNKIVNIFAEIRLDRILSNSIEPDDKDVSEMLKKFIKRLKEPEFNESNFASSVSHILQTPYESCFDEFKPKKIKDIINICKKDYNFDVNISDIKEYHHSRNSLHLRKELVEKYQKLFMIYLTTNDSIYSSEYIHDITTPFFKKHIFRASKLAGRHIEISMMDIIIRFELRILRLICESTILDSKKKWGNFIEELYINYTIFEKNELKYYLYKFFKENDLWSLNLLSLFFPKNKNLGLKTFIDPFGAKKLFINHDIEEYNIQLLQKINISKNILSYDISDLYKRWNNDNYLYKWDNFWNNEIKLCYKNRINKSERKILEKIYSNTESDGKKTKKQRIATKIREEVLLYFANYCEIHREETYKKIELKVREHFYYKIRDTTLRNWLKNNCRYCVELKDKSVAEIKDNITTEIAQQWWNDYLKAKGR